MITEAVLSVCRGFFYICQSAVFLLVCLSVPQLQNTDTDELLSEREDEQDQKDVLFLSDSERDDRASERER